MHGQLPSERSSSLVRIGCGCRLFARQVALGCFTFDCFLFTQRATTTRGTRARLSRAAAIPVRRTSSPWAMGARLCPNGFQWPTATITASTTPALLPRRELAAWRAPPASRATAAPSASVRRWQQCSLLRQREPAESCETCSLYNFFYQPVRPVVTRLTESVFALVSSPTTTSTSLP